MDGAALPCAPEGTGAGARAGGEPEGADSPDPRSHCPGLSGSVLTCGMGPEKHCPAWSVRKTGGLRLGGGTSVPLAETGSQELLRAGCSPNVGCGGPGAETEPGELPGALLSRVHTGEPVTRSVVCSGPRPARGSWAISAQRGDAESPRRPPHSPTARTWGDGVSRCLWSGSSFSSRGAARGL